MVVVLFQSSGTRERKYLYQLVKFAGKKRGIFTKKGLQNIGKNEEARSCCKDEVDDSMPQKSRY